MIVLAAPLLLAVPAGLAAGWLAWSAADDARDSWLAWLEERLQDAALGVAFAVVGVLAAFVVVVVAVTRLLGSGRGSVAGGLERLASQVIRSLGRGPNYIIILIGLVVGFALTATEIGALIGVPVIIGTLAYAGITVTR